jgi:hypothetical protein
MKLHWLLVLLLVGCSGFNSLVFHTGQTAGKWTLDNYSSNVRIDNTGSFTFPVGYPGVHMISKTVSPLKVGGNLSVTFEITGTNPVFEAAGLTPELRLFIGANFAYSLGPNNARPLKLGKQTLTVPLTSDNWKDITGVPYNSTPARTNLFNRSIPKCTMVAMIFGDEHGNAHGADLSSGSAKFRVISFSP